MAVVSAAPRVRHTVRLSLLGFMVSVAMLTAACGRTLPARQEPPAPGQQAAIGVAYAVSPICPVPLELGGRWWSFDQRLGEWPPDIAREGFHFPFLPYSETVSMPYAVPGTVTLTDADHATFRADVNGAEFSLIRHDANPEPGVVCL